MIRLSLYSIEFEIPLRAPLNSLGNRFAFFPFIDYHLAKFAGVYNNQ